MKTLPNNHSSDQKRAQDFRLESIKATVVETPDNTRCRGGPSLGTRIFQGFSETSRDQLNNPDLLAKLLIEAVLIFFF